MTILPTGNSLYCFRLFFLFMSCFCFFFEHWTMDMTFLKKFRKYSISIKLNGNQIFLKKNFLPFSTQVFSHFFAFSQLITAIKNVYLLNLLLTERHRDTETQRAKYRQQSRIMRDISLVIDRFKTAYLHYKKSPPSIWPVHFDKMQIYTHQKKNPKN